MEEAGETRTGKRWRVCDAITASEMRSVSALNIPGWYRPAEHISKCGDAVFGEGTQTRKQWGAYLHQIMRKGKV